MLILGVIGVPYLLGAYRNMPAAAIEGKYSRTGSRFIELYVVRIHSLDVGTGLVVMLLHANVSNLLDGPRGRTRSKVAIGSSAST